MPSTTELIAWHAKYPQAGIAIITGAFSGLAVVDIDGPLEAGLTLLSEHDIVIPETTLVRSARGWHVWFQHPGIAVKSVSNVLVDRDSFPSSSPTRTTTRRRRGETPRLPSADCSRAPART